MIYLPDGAVEVCNVGAKINKEINQTQFLNLLKKSDHQTIVEYLDKQPLGSRLPNNDTLFKTILEQGTNGDEIIKKVLKYVNTVSFNHD